MFLLCEGLFACHHRVGRGGPGCAGMSRSERCWSRARWPAAMLQASLRRNPEQNSRLDRPRSSAPIGRYRTDPRRRRLLFHGHGRTGDPARGLRAGHRLQGIHAGAEKPAERQDFDDLFRMGGLERPEDHRSLAADRRSGDRGRRRQRNPEDADPQGLAHLDLGRDQFCDAAVRRRTRIAACGA